VDSTFSTGKRYQVKDMALVKFDFDACTVYRNLNKIFVKEGDEISLKSSIGEAALNYRETRRELLFDLYAHNGPVAKSKRLGVKLKPDNKVYENATIDFSDYTNNLDNVAWTGWF
jgi:hypothetical protein